MNELHDALTTALNCTFPAVLRTHSWYALERLHGYATYEQWYNGELVMHLGREVNGSELDGDWVWVRGEAPIETRSDRTDWAILKQGPSFAFARPFDQEHVLAVGETKIIGLGNTGSGPKAEVQKIDRLAEQLNKEVLSECLRFAHLVFPCWRKRGGTLDDTARESLRHVVFPKIHEQFDVKTQLRHVQVVTGWFGFETEQGTADAEVQTFGLLQLLLHQAPGGAWQALMPPRQHQLAQYLAATETPTPVHAG